MYRRGFLGAITAVVCAPLNLFAGVNRKNLYGFDFQISQFVNSGKKSGLLYYITSRRDVNNKTSMLCIESIEWVSGDVSRLRQLASDYIIIERGSRKLPYLIDVSDFTGSACAIEDLNKMEEALIRSINS